MADIINEGLSRKEAYNFLKGIIGVKKSVLIYHLLFDSVFKKISDNRYDFITTKEKVCEALEKIKIKERSNECYQMKQAGKNDEVHKISIATVNDFEKELKSVA
jgi:hypothetical protein